MKFHCPGCQKKYRVDPVHIPAKGVQMRCKRCQTLMLITPDSVGVADGAAQDEPSADRPDALAVAPVATVEPVPDEGARTEKDGPGPDARDSIPVPAAESAEEARLRQVLEQDGPDAAARLLLDRVKAAIAENDFASAESRRDKIYEMAPAALNEIIIANELIEQGKSRAIDPTHLEMFAALYGRLTAEETNTIYFALKPKRVKAHDIIFRQGEFVSDLFLIEKGRLKLVFNDPRSQKEMFLKALYPGDITNIEAFLSFTGNTVSLMADSDATLAYLEKEVLIRWEEGFPGLETKLSEHLHKQENIRSMVKKAGLNIRAHQRIKTDLKVLVQMSSSKGEPQRAPFSVNLQDISLGGLCYEMRLDKKQEAAKLLGQRLTVQAELPGPPGSNEFRRRGKIVAVRIQPFGASTVHVQFDKLLDKNTLIDISQHRPAGGPT